MIRLCVDPVHPSPDALQHAAAVLARGGVVAYPTDTLYGLAVDPARESAVEALFRIKARQARQAIPLVAADLTQVEQVGRMTPLAAILALRFWPGPLTLVIGARPGLSDAVHAGTGRVAIRIPDHRLAQGLAAAAGRALTSTSANRSGEAAPSTADGVASALGDEVDLLLDGGPSPGGLPSTIVDVAGDEPLLLRPGAVAWDRVLESLRRR
jgi:L-threonylcarbamoyladenylate synthase